MSSVLCFAVCCVYFALQLWTDQTTSWQSISDPLAISKWALQTSSNELVPVNLEDYHFPANGSLFKLVPFGRHPSMEQDQQASFPTALQGSGAVTAITGSLTVGDGRVDTKFACPIQRTDFVDFGSGKVLRPDDQLDVMITSTIAPARVQFCGRALGQPRFSSNNNYVYNFFAQVKDEQTACILKVYLPLPSGILAVYQQATSISVQMPAKGEACEQCAPDSTACRVCKRARACA